MPSFVFAQKDYTVLEDLINNMGIQWEEGKRILFNGTLRAHVRKLDLPFANNCASAERAYTNSPDKGDHIFLGWLCGCPGIMGLYWKGIDYGNIKTLSIALSGSQNITLENLLLDMLKRKILSRFVMNNGGEESLINNVRFLEESFNKSRAVFPKKNAIPMLEVFFSGRKKFKFDGQVMTTPMDLANYLQLYADKSKDALSKKIQPLFQDDYNFDPYFEAWIIMQGFQRELERWKTRFQE